MSRSGPRAPASPKENAGRPARRLRLRITDSRSIGTAGPGRSAPVSGAARRDYACGLNWIGSGLRRKLLRPRTAALRKTRAGVLMRLPRTHTDTPLTPGSPLVDWRSVSEEFLRRNPVLKTITRLPKTLYMAKSAKYV